MRQIALALVPVFLLASVVPSHAQFTDLQPGPNFAPPTHEFGKNRSENIDVGDVDNDGDLDVIVANGGDFGNEPNRIFINAGGLQGGTVGVFNEETATRFAGVPDDASRDIDFADIDGDGDLDVFVANRGHNSAGQVSRFYVNQGGLQAGALGFFGEDTNNRWGALLDVPQADQVFGGDAGPWEDWSCECEFADLDNDGDLDLFHSSYGPSMNGSRPSRIFLNDGAGVFDELFPWVDPGADIMLHTRELALMDLDGDFDLDIVNASRDSQARIFISNLYSPTTGSTQLYTDTTEASLFATGSTASGFSNYETEVADFDGDGDFDAWMGDYFGDYRDKILLNKGLDANGAVVFQESNGPGPVLIHGDPFSLDLEVNAIDFDGDGDLDVMAANFSGTNHVYVGGNAQGLAGQYHNTTGQGTSLYPQIETPGFGNSGTARDGEAGDLDNDGDTDYLIANDANQDNDRWDNVLGVPDTHAPEALDERIAVGLAVGSGGGVVVNVQLRDNAPSDLIRLYDVVLVHQPGDVSVDMFSQGSQQFRAEIPASATSFVIHATDLAGNIGISNVQDLGGAFTELGCADAGVTGAPLFSGAGPLTAGSAASLLLSSAAPSAPAMFFVAFGPGGAGAPFKGGTLKAVPVLFGVALTTDATGSAAIPFVTPGGLSGGSVVGQWAISDAVASANASLSNALQFGFP